MIIDKLKQLFFSIKNDYRNYKIGNYFYRSSLHTSCVIPVYKQEKFIWSVSVFCFESGIPEHYWTESEEELENLLQFLDLTCYTYRVKRYSINQ